MSVIHYFDPDLTTPDALLERYSTIRPLAQALRDEGAEVTVLQRFHRDFSLQDQGVHFEFRGDQCRERLPKWQIPLSFHSAVRAVCKAACYDSRSTVVHVHSLMYALQTKILRTVLPSSCAMVVQHHAEHPWRKSARPLQRWALQSADGFFFAAQGIGNSWVDQGLISKRQRIFQVMEGSTQFRCSERTVARVSTGLSGNPVVLWVGRLIPLKDPLTVLNGFEIVLQHLPEARLYMAYGDAALLPAIRNRIASSPRLTGGVALLGTVAHDQLQHIYNSADYFVSGSHYEGSSFSLAEALACGVVPVVTDIPSFRAMTDDGKIGACWAPGSATAFVEAFLGVVRQPLRPLSNQAVRFFHDQLSYPAIARNSIRAYEEVVSSRVGKKP